IKILAPIRFGARGRAALSSSRADSLPVDRQRRIWSDEPLFAHFTPEVTRDDGRECGMVFDNAFGAAGACDDGGRAGGGARELEGGRLDVSPVGLGEGLDALDLGKNLRGRLLVLEVGAADQYPRTIGATDDDIDVLGGCGGHQALQRALVVEQRVAAG